MFFFCLNRVKFSYKRDQNIFLSQLNFLGFRKILFYFLIDEHVSQIKKVFSVSSDAFTVQTTVQIYYTFFPLDDTLILVTADHSHVFTLGGYQTRGNPIFGLTNQNGPIARDGKRFTTLGYFNGPGAVVNGPRDDPNDTDTTAKDYLQQSLVPRSSETHAGEDVGKSSLSHPFIIKFPIELLKYRNKTAEISADIAIILFKVNLVNFSPSPKYYKYDNCWKPKLLRRPKYLPPKFVSQNFYGVEFLIFLHFADIANQKLAISYNF